MKWDCRDLTEYNMSYLAPFLKIAADALAEEFPSPPTRSEKLRVALPFAIGGGAGAVGGSVGGTIAGLHAGDYLANRIMGNSTSIPRAVLGGLAAGGATLAGSLGGLYGGARAGSSLGELATRAMLPKDRQQAVYYHNLAGVNAEPDPEDSLGINEALRADQQKALEAWRAARGSQG
jgi:hypothetical protein